MKLSAVIPVYNSADTLDSLLQRLEPALRAAASEFEVVLVNDGSRDASWDRIRELAVKNPYLKGVNLLRNYGQHNALLCGIRAASGDTIVTLDDDLQNPPEEIPSLLARLAEGFDVVYGTPRQEQHGFLRDLASQMTKVALQGAMGVSVARKVSAFRVFRTKLRDAFAHFNGPFVSIDVLLTWATTKFTAVEVRHDARAVGASGYTIRKLITHAMNMITGFTTLPLQVASYIGFGLTIFGVLVFFYVVGRYVVQGTPVQGFPFLASIIAIFSGAQLFALGIMGEYLARMHFRLMTKPSYAVGDTTDQGSTGT